MVINNNYIDVYPTLKENISLLLGEENIQQKSEDIEFSNTELAEQRRENKFAERTASENGSKNEAHRVIRPLENKASFLNKENIAEISFQGNRKEIYFNPLQNRLDLNDWVIVETENGCDLGKITKLGECIYSRWLKDERNENLPVHSIKYKANPKDIEKYKENLKEQKVIVEKVKKMSEKYKLEMRVTEAEWQFDKRRLTIYFLSPQRVDFRELVKDLAKEYKTRIELRQITHRERAKRISNWVGVCGRPICCGSFLDQTKSISIEHTKVQQLSANVTKLSGYCGRLKCCLLFEYDYYLEESKRFPKLGSKLELNEGYFTLIKFDIFKENLTFYNNEAHNFRTFSLEEIKQFAAQNKIIEPKDTDACIVCNKLNDEDLSELLEISE